MVAASFSLAAHTKASLMIPSLRERTPAGVIQELSQLLQREACVPDMLPFYHAALNREFLISTAMDQGLAFPHAPMVGLKELWFALGRVPGSMSWGRRDSLPVNLVFLLAVPATESTGYLHLMAVLSRLSKETSVLERLRNAGSADEMLEALEAIQVPGRLVRQALSAE